MAVGEKIWDFRCNVSYIAASWWTRARRFQKLLELFVLWLILGFSTPWAVKLPGLGASYTNDNAFLLRQITVYRAELLNQSFLGFLVEGSRTSVLLVQETI